MPTVTNVSFPYNKNRFHVTLYERGNAPDYSYVYAPGVQAARGFSEGYDLNNCPKDDDSGVIDVSGNVGTDMMRFNYLKIDYGNTGDGTKWYFVTSKVILNYPSFDASNNQQNYTMQYNITLDYWETYKDKLGTPNIQLDRVTTSDPAGWSDTTNYKTGILPFSNENRVTSDVTAAPEDWKAVVMWRAKKPTAQDNYVVDKLPTVFKIEEGNQGIQNWAQALEDLASEPPEATNLFRSYIGCNSYLVPKQMATKNGTSSDLEILAVNFPAINGVHNILKYYPFRRAFIKTIDGSCYELDPNKFSGERLPDTVGATVCHSMTPSPHSIITPHYAEPTLDVVCFAGYPALSVTTTTPTQIQKVMSNIGGNSIDVPVRLQAASGRFIG